MANNKDVIKLLFGVLGDDSITTGSGAEIKEKLGGIVDNISKEGKLKVKIGLDTAEVEKELKELQERSEKVSKAIKEATKEPEKTSVKAPKQVNEIDQKIKNIKKTFKEVAKETGRGFSALNDGSFKYNLELDKAKEKGNAFLNTLKEINKEKLTTSQKEIIDNIGIEARDKFLDQKNLGKAKEYDKFEKLIGGYNKIAARATEGVGTKYSKIIKNNKKASIIYDDLIKKVSEYQTLLEKTNPAEKGSVAQADKAYKELTSSIAGANKQLGILEKQSETTGKKMLETISSKLMQTAAYAIIAVLTVGIKKIYSNVKDLDKAITDLQIATGKSRTSVKELVKDYAKLGDEIGATTIEVSKAADTWLRQGYSIQQAQDLIRSTMMLAKLGQIESEEASRALTSAMKGYGYETKNVISIVDKLTAVDMQAAVSAGNIAKSMSETATGARIAGVDMDKLIGYIATVSEVTQDGAESVGVFYKTMFARMGNVKAGKFIDDETGESLNDVEKVLKKLGISLTDEAGIFRNFGEVLDEVGSKWNTFNHNEQRAIATAFGGTRQQEKFIVLMENYKKALEYSQVSANSAGTAELKFENAYMESIEAKFSRLEAAWQGFSQSILDSSIIKDTVDFLTEIIKLLTQGIEVLGGVPTKLFLIVSGLTLVHKLIFGIVNSGRLHSFINILKSSPKILKSVVGSIKDAGLNFTKWKIETTQTKKNLEKISREVNNINGKTFVAKKGGITGSKKYTGKASKATAGAVGGGAAKGLSLGLTAGGVAAIIAEVIAAVVIGALEITGSVFQRKFDERIKKAEDLKEAAEEDFAKYSKNKEKTTSLSKISEEYTELQDKINSGDKDKEDALKRISILQADLIKLLGKEAETIDLINGDYQTQNNLLKDKKKELVNQEIETGKKAYSSNKTATDAEEIVFQDNISGWDPLNNTTSHQIVIDIGSDAEDAEDSYKIAEAFKKLGIGTESATLGDKFIMGDLTGNLDTKIETLKKLLEEIKDSEKKNPRIYKKLSTLLAQYEKVRDDRKDKGIDYLNSLSKGIIINAGQNVNSLADFEKFKQEINTYIEALQNGNIENIQDENIKSYLTEIKKLIDDGVIEAKNVENIINSSIVNYYSGWEKESRKFKEGVIPTLKEFSDVLDEVNNKFNILDKGLKDLNKNGIVSLDTISQIKKEYPELMDKVFIKDLGENGKGGYILNPKYTEEEVLNDFIKEFLQPYVNELDKYEEGTENAKIAQENLNNALIVAGGLLRSSQIEKETKSLKKQKEVLDKQSNSYKDLLKLRKDLLNTYKEELSYQKQLKEKQEKVSNLNTKLALLSLDESAEGKAEARKIQEELKKAKEEAEDFTLQKAIEDINKTIDKDQREYEGFIKNQLDEINKNIENVAKNLNVNTNSLLPGVTHSPWTSYDIANKHEDISGMNDFDESAQLMTEEEFNQSGKEAKIGETTFKFKTYQAYLDKLYEYYKKKFNPSTPSYHTGGIVGGEKLKSNETFAKLMKGEFVSTPEQMERFIGKTLPNLTSAGVGTTIQNNSPLIEIKCGNITEESLPDLKTIVNQAVNKIEKNMESALSRTGFVKKY